MPVRHASPALADEVATRLGRPVTEARTLPGHWYADADHHALEMDRVFGRSWVGVAGTNQVEKEDPASSPSRAKPALAPPAQAADIVLALRIGRESDKYNFMATSSFVATIAIFDALLAALIEETDYTREMFGLIHPGGAVGDMLKKEKA